MIWTNSWLSKSIKKNKKPGIGKNQDSTSVEKVTGGKIPQEAEVDSFTPVNAKNACTPFGFNNYSIPSYI